MARAGGAIRRSVPMAGPVMGVAGRTVDMGLDMGGAVVVVVTRRAVAVRVTVRPVMVVMTISVVVAGSGGSVVRSVSAGPGVIVAGTGSGGVRGPVLAGMAAVPVVRATVVAVGPVAIVRRSRVAGENLWFGHGVGVLLADVIP